MKIDWETVFNYFEGITLVAGVILITEYMRYTPLLLIGDIGIGTFGFIATEHAIRSATKKLIQRTRQSI